jgi:translation elongation factor EF-1alpha
LENGKKNTNTTFLRPNMTAIVRIYSEKYLCCEKYEENVNLGSFTLRDEGLYHHIYFRTIALGKVLRIKPVKTS